MSASRDARNRSPSATKLGLLVFLFAGLWASAGFSAQERLWEGQGIRGIRISGFKGNLNFMADDKAAQTTINASAKDGEALSQPWKPEVSVHDDGWLVVNIEGPSSKSDWRLPKIPALNIDIRSRSVPIVVAWKEGDIRLKGWKSASQITHYKGAIHADATKEALRIMSIEGDVEVSNHIGRLNIDTYRSKVTLLKVIGNSQIHNFSGQLRLEQCKGDVQLSSSKGRNTLDAQKGALEFNLDAGELNLTKYSGPIRGKTEQGSVSAQLVGTADFKVRSDSGRVAIAVPRSSGARVNLVSEEGNIAIQFGIKVDRLENMKIGRGTLSGKESGVIQVKSHSGDIRLRPLG
jgi:hypothetical protein